MFVHPEMRYPFDYTVTYFVQHFEQQMLERLQSGRKEKNVFSFNCLDQTSKKKVQDVFLLVFFSVSATSLKTQPQTGQMFS